MHSFCSIIDRICNNDLSKRECKSSCTTTSSSRSATALEEHLEYIIRIHSHSSLIDFFNISSIIIPCFLLWIREDRVSLSNILELLFSFFLLLISLVCLFIRVEPNSCFTVSFLNCIFVCILCDSQYFVIVLSLALFQF